LAYKDALCVFGVSYIFSKYLDTKNDKNKSRGGSLVSSPFWFKKIGRPSIVERAACNIVIEGFNLVNN